MALEPKTDAEFQAEHEKELAGLNTYTDHLEEVNRLYDLYFTADEIHRFMKAKLPHKNNLWRRLGLNEEIKRLEATVSDLQRTKNKVTDQIAEAQKEFWKLVIKHDPEDYPYDLDHFEQHMAEIDRAAFEM